MSASLYLYHTHSHTCTRTPQMEGPGLGLVIKWPKYFTVWSKGGVSTVWRWWAAVTLLISKTVMSEYARMHTHTHTLRMTGANSHRRRTLGFPCGSRISVALSLPHWASLGLSAPTLLTDTICINTLFIIVVDTGAQGIIRWGKK